MWVSQIVINFRLENRWANKCSVSLPRKTSLWFALNKCLEYRRRMDFGVGGWGRLVVVVVFVLFCFCNLICIYLSDGIRLSHTHRLSRTPLTSLSRAVRHRWHFQIKELKIPLAPKGIRRGGFLLNRMWNGGFHLNALCWEILAILVSQQPFEFWNNMMFSF